MRVAVVVTAVAVAGAVAGCGDDARSAVRAKVEQFAQATRTHDYRTICDDVLAPSLLRRMAQAGLGCEQAMSIAFAHVSDPRLAIGTVTIHGSRASVLTISQASGQSSTLTSLRLVDTSRGWRISALASPVGS